MLMKQNITRLAIRISNYVFKVYLLNCTVDIIFVAWCWNDFISYDDGVYKALEIKHLGDLWLCILSYGLNNWIDLQ